MKLSDTDLSFADRQMVEVNLMQKEEVLWVGKPIPRLFSAGSLGSFIFSLPWLAFVAFWTWGASQASALFACFSIPFWCIGLGLASSPWLGLRKQKRTVLVITNRRACFSLHTETSISPRNTMKHTPNFSSSGRTEQDFLIKIRGVSGSIAAVTVSV